MEPALRVDTPEQLNGPAAHLGPSTTEAPSAQQHQAEEDEDGTPEDVALSDVENAKHEADDTEYREKKSHASSSEQGIEESSGALAGS